jgi:hypothetical protein
MPRAAMSVATSTRTAPDLKSFNALSRWFCERLECSVAVGMPFCSSCRAMRSAPCFMREKTSTMSMADRAADGCSSAVFKCFGTS